jgi:hypothetical protein
MKAKKSTAAYKAFEQWWRRAGRLSLCTELNDYDSPHLDFTDLFELAHRAGWRAAQKQAAGRKELS